MASGDDIPPETFDATDGQNKGGLLGKLLIGLFVLLLLGAGVLGGGYYWLHQQFKIPGPLVEDTIVLVEPGSGLIRIAYQLEDEGVVSDSRVFRANVMIEQQASNLRAGEFLIPAGASMEDVLDILQSGQPVQHALTLAEGLTSEMIVALVNEHEMLSGEAEIVPPEGSLLPETYLFDRGTRASDLLARMNAAQIDLLEELWPQRADNLPFDTPEEAIILASIVEKETGLAEERPLVASVFVNRLRRPMRLQSDPTIIYGITGGESLGRGIRRSELDNADNPYNTYENDGLPPTPIANPGRAAIEAVLNPPDTLYLYFVADGTGGHVFATTLTEHNRNVAQWRRIERERAQEGG